MLRLLFCVIAISGILQLMNFSDTSKRPDALSLDLTKPKQDDLFPASKDYGAVLTNRGNSSVPIEAVQMPGGYAGSGRFYACSLQFWKASNRKWVTPRPAKLTDFGATPSAVVKVGLDPGMALQVCTSLLPEQQGHVGDFVRFALSLQWNQEPTVFSKIFTIGHKK